MIKLDRSSSKGFVLREITYETLRTITSIERKLKSISKNPQYGYGSQPNMSDSLFAAGILPSGVRNIL